MHDGIILSYIGLSDLEIRVLKSIFSLAPQLNENYVLVPPEQVDEADVILLNADDPDSIQRWTELQKANDLVTSVLLTDDADLADAERTLQRPIRVQKLVSALEDIVDQTSVDITEQQEEVEINLLVVDDSYPVRKYMEHKLSELASVPIKISFCASGEEAIARASRTPYDLIFLDVMMEGLDGYKVCKTIKSRGEAYIVMLTSKKSPFDKVRGTMSGCDAYITKPPEDERLREELGKCLLRRNDLTLPAPAANAT